MTKLERDIRRSIEADAWQTTEHAQERLFERGVEPWQAAAASVDGSTLNVSPTAHPNPTIMIAGTLPDGAGVAIVWAWSDLLGCAMLVTVYFPTP